MEIDFYKLWNDPVWSKVIGGLIVALIIFLISGLYKMVVRKKRVYQTDEEMILESLQTKQFPTGRTTSGIITDTGLGRDKVNKNLMRLENEGVVEQKKGKKNIWSLTIKGKKKK